MNKDYYKILNVKRDSTEDEIKRSFRKLSLQYHPDRQQNKSDKEKKEAEEKFKDIAEAYSVLSDKEKKQYYDTFGTIDGMGNSPFNGGPDDDIFNFVKTHFGMGSNPFRQERIFKGTDKKLKINITMSELYNNVSKTVKYKIDRPCKTCKGSGSRSGSVDTCPYCHGTGTITEVVRQGNFISQSSHPCHYCQGTGYYVKDKCPNCNDGLVQETEEITVVVPTIDKLGITYTKRGAGNSCFMNKGVNGDLSFNFSLSDSEGNFKINPDNIIDIIYEANISVLDCLTGCEIKIKHLDGKEYTVGINKCSKDGDVYRLVGKGFKASNGYTGNLLIRVRCQMPDKLNDNEIKTLNKLKKSDNFSKIK